MSKSKLSTVKRVALATAVLLGCAAFAPAFARGHVSVGIGINVPVGYYDYNRPYYGEVYYPAPVYYRPAPRVIYYDYPVYERPVIYHHGYHERHYYRVYHRHDDDED